MGCSLCAPAAIPAECDPSTAQVRVLIPSSLEGAHSGHCSSATIVARHQQQKAALLGRPSKKQRIIDLVMQQKQKEGALSQVTAVPMGANRADSVPGKQFESRPWALLCHSTPCRIVPLHARRAEGSSRRHRGIPFPHSVFPQPSAEPSFLFP